MLGQRLIALLLASLLAASALAQQPELTATQVTERLSEWDQGYARLRRDIWNLQRATSLFGRDLRGRTLSDDLRDFALSNKTEQDLAAQRTLLLTQLSKGDTKSATESLLALYRHLRDELARIERIGEHRMRYRQVAKQRALWRQLASVVPSYQVPENIRRLEQQAVEQLNAGHFEPTATTTYRELLQAYATERDGFWKRGVAANSVIDYPRRSPCGEPAKTTTSTAFPSLVSTTQPEYPAAAKQAEEEGAVYLQLLVGNTGCVLRYAIQFSAGWPALDDAALAWAETLQFVPSTKNGKSVDAWVTLPVIFRLED